MQLTFNQIAAIRTCLHHTIRRFEEKSITAVSHAEQYRRSNVAKTIWRFR
jgi:hypothetical protein